MPHPVPRSRPARAGPPVVDLARARDARRLRDFEARCRGIDDVNRRALARLFQSGLLFTRQGARLGRDLLLAHQLLLLVGELLARIGEAADGTAAAREVEELYCEAQKLLARTSKLTSRTGLVLARGR